MSNRKQREPSVIHKIKCGTCNEDFYPADLAEVLKHEHNGMECESKIGLLVERTFAESESLNIKRLKFRYEDGSVDVLFRQYEKEYRYLDVPADILVAFANSDTPGAFLAQKMKGNFRYYAL